MTIGYVYIYIFHSHKQYAKQAIFPKKNGKIVLQVLKKPTKYADVMQNVQNTIV